MDNCELTRYLTLDVLLTSESDLTGLVNALEKQGVFIVYNGQNEAGGFYAVLEPPVDVDDESPDTQAIYIAKTVEGLAPNIHQMWSRNNRGQTTVSTYQGVIIRLTSVRRSRTEEIALYES